MQVAWRTVDIARFPLSTALIQNIGSRKHERDNHLQKRTRLPIRMKPMIKREELFDESAADFSSCALLDCCECIRFVLVDSGFEQAHSCISSKRSRNDSGIF